LYSGISAGAEEIAEVVENRMRKGRKFSLLVVAEGGSPSAYDRLMAHTMGNFGDFFALDIRSVVGRLKMVSLSDNMIHLSEFCFP